MQLVVCEYCGTEYRDNLPRCPLCGKAAATAVRNEAQQGSGASSEVKSGTSGSVKKKDRIPKWMWMVSCIILALAVLLCTVYILFVMGAFSGGEKVPVHVEEQIQTEVPEELPIQEPEVPVEDPEVLCTDLVLNQTEVILEEKSGFVFLTVIPEPMDCTETIFFSISDPSIAEIEATDELTVKVTALEPGTAMITISCGTVTKTCTVHCLFEEALEELPEETEEPVNTEEPVEEEETTEETEEPVEPTLNNIDFTLFHPGESFRLVVNNAPEGANITYTSSNPAVATVSNTGLVTAVGSGTSYLTVKVNDTVLTSVARCNLADSAETGGTAEETTQVPAETVTDVNYKISHVDVTLKTGDPAFVLTLLEEDGTAVVGEVWSSSNSQICTVDANGKVAAVGNTGTANVSTIYGGKTYTCTVRCYYP